MGQKVNPRGLRIGINADWNSNWYANKKNFSKFLKCDNEIRKFLMDFDPIDIPSEKTAGISAQEIDKIKKTSSGTRISKIVISRSLTYLRVAIYTGRPASIIGEKGSGSVYIKQKIAKIVKECGCADTASFVLLDVIPIKNPDADAQLVAMDIASQLEKRTSFRRAMKSAMQRAKKVGIKGIKTKVSGRLDGSDIARSEHYHDGSVPLHTLRADIDYGFAEARTTYGRLGIKVWIYKGEVFNKRTTEGGAN